MFRLGDQCKPQINSSYVLGISTDTNTLWVTVLIRPIGSSKGKLGHIYTVDMVQTCRGHRGKPLVELQWGEVWEVSVETGPCCELSGTDRVVSSPVIIWIMGDRCLVLKSWLEWWSPASLFFWRVIDLKKWKKIGDRDDTSVVSLHGSILIQSGDSDELLTVLNNPPTPLPTCPPPVLIPGHGQTLLADH